MRYRTVFIILTFTVVEDVISVRRLSKYQSNTKQLSALRQADTDEDSGRRQDDDDDENELNPVNNGIVGLNAELDPNNKGSVFTPTSIHEDVKSIWSSLNEKIKGVSSRLPRLVRYMMIGRNPMDLADKIFKRVFSKGKRMKFLTEADYPKLKIFKTLVDEYKTDGSIDVKKWFKFIYGRYYKSFLNKIGFKTKLSETVEDDGDDGVKAFESKDMYWVHLMESEAMKNLPSATVEEDADNVADDTSNDNEVKIPLTEPNQKANKCKKLCTSYKDGQCEASICQPLTKAKNKLNANSKLNSKSQGVKYSKGSAGDEQKLNVKTECVNKKLCVKYENDQCIEKDYKRVCKEIENTGNNVDSNINSPGPGDTVKDDDIDIDHIDINDADGNAGADGNDGNDANDASDANDEKYEDNYKDGNDDNLDEDGKPKDTKNTAHIVYLLPFRK